MQRSLIFVVVALVGLLCNTVRAGIVQSFQQTGNIGLEIAAAAGGNNSLVTGSLTLSQVVPGPVLKATLYANDWSGGPGSGGPLDLIFAGIPAGTNGPFNSDVALTTLYSYQWDVSSIVGGPGTFNYAIGQSSPGFQISGLALAVVYADPSAPKTTVTILEGAKQIGESGAETESANFTGLPAGATSLSVFTISDDTTGTGEAVQYNGNSVGGPIDANLGFNASLLTMSSTSLAGSNTVSISTGSDHMGWLLATSAVSVPEPSTLMMLLASSLAVIGFRWRRQRRRE